MFSATYATYPTLRRLSFRCALLCLLSTSIVGCASAPKLCPPATEPEVKIIRPSSGLLQPSNIEPLAPRVLVDYVDYSVRCEAALAKCDADKVGIQQETAGDGQEDR